MLAPTELLAGDHESLGAVSSSHPLATEAGEAILQGGKQYRCDYRGVPCFVCRRTTMSDLGGRAQALVSEKGKNLLVTMG